MRKIEQQMIKAVKNKTDWRNDNTTVFYFSDKPPLYTLCERAEIYLHNNHIATYWYDKDDDQLEVNERTLAKWPTPTTKSRLRALGANVTTKAGVTYLNGKAV